MRRRIFADEHQRFFQQMMRTVGRTRLGTAAMLCALAGSAASAGAQNHAGAMGGTRGRGSPPSWAYPVNPPPAPPASDDSTPLTVPGSALTLRRAQTTDRFFVPDWHPAAHPPMPEVVGRGRRPDVFACGYCHLPNGLGRPENASLAGLSATYIVRQMRDFKSGQRRSSEPGMVPPMRMLTIAKGADDAEVQAAADYFARLRPARWIRVVETRVVPKTRVGSSSMLVRSEEGGREPIGGRIIELAEDITRTELRDPASGFIAFVPVGSIARGRALVTTGGGGRTQPCATCHGPDYRGEGDVPPLAGRSPSYLMRQLYDFKSGARDGALAAPMRQNVARLTIRDMTAITAYLASRHP
jgi:cytochrome c553